MNSAWDEFAGMCNFAGMSEWVVVAILTVCVVGAVVCLVRGELI
jgi:hypothetical protein